MSSSTRMAKFELDRVYTEEADLLKKATEWLELHRRDGIKVIRINDRYAKGYSDLFICVRGIFVCAELKDNIGEASVHQKQFLQDMLEAGAIGGVCRTLREVINLVETAKRRRQDWT